MNAWNRRGVAMLLLLIALLMTTILTAGYLASRDNSAAIGENVVRAAEARWAATSGLGLGCAILETDADWRTGHSNGKLLDDYSIGNGVIDLDVIDGDTGLPPDESTTVALITATAVVNGVSQTAAARVTVVGGGSKPTIDIDLSEFAIFANEVDIQDTSTIARWLSAPSSAGGEQIAVGTGATGMGAISAGASTAPLDMVVYHGPGASSAVVINGTGQPIGSVGLLDPIRLPLPPPPPPMPGTYISTFVASGSDVPMPGSMTAGDFLVNDGAVALSDEQIVYVRQQSVLVDGGLYIDGDVTLVFEKPLILSNAFIEVSPGSTLTIFANGGIDFSRSYVGPDRIDPLVRDHSGAAPYVNPEHVRLLATGGAWSVDQNSVVHAVAYAPGSNLSIGTDSALYGSYVGQSLTMTQNAALFYDTALNDFEGFVNASSAVYLPNGRINPAVAGVPNLSAAALDALAAATGAIVAHNGQTHGVPAVLPIGNPNAPTPRTVFVQVNLLTFGAANAEMELMYLGAYTTGTPGIQNVAIMDLIQPN